MKKIIAIFCLLILGVGIGFTSAIITPDNRQITPDNGGFNTGVSPVIIKETPKSGGSCLTKYTGYDALSKTLIKADLVEPSGNIIRGEYCQVWVPQFRKVITDEMINTDMFATSFYNPEPLPSNWWRLDMKEYW